MQILDRLYAFIWSDPTANNCNTYLVDSEKRILVDPGHYHLFGNVRENLARLSLSPRDIDLVIVTHCHPDHMEALKVFADTDAMIAIHGAEMDFMRTMAPHYGELLGVFDFEPHILLQEGDMRVGNVAFQILHTPGHSPGSICLYWPETKALFTGDVVFKQGVGRTDVPGGSGEALKESIKRIAALEVDHLLPGHGDTLSGRELVKANFTEIESFWFAYL